MSRNFDQIMLSKETDSWVRQWHGSIGTVIGGTVSLSVSPTTGRDIQFITGLSFSSNLANCEVHLLNGTAFLYTNKLVIPGTFWESFLTPLKSSEGTSLVLNIQNLFGTVCANMQGYTVK